MNGADTPAAAQAAPEGKWGITYNYINSCTSPKCLTAGYWNWGVVYADIVRKSQAGSHQNRGWELFTDAAIKVLSEGRNDLVFILWGNYARSKKQFVNLDKHYVIESPHPSPFSAHSGFFGSRPFSKSNDYLNSRGIAPINWNLA